MPTNKHSFTLDESALKSILLDNDRVRDSKVIVLSIAGAYRKGKSFMLNFFQRYLYAQGSENWIADLDTPLKGFPWKRGAERQTTGILMWSEPFEVVLPGDEKAFVLLMDTQGLFDSKSTVKDCATIFALSTMLSSVQVYNITSNIQEDDLQHLQLFMEYGRLAVKGRKSKPFQDLHFLVRDWPNADEHEFGWKGGEELLKKRLQITSDQPQELQDLRSHLHFCFEKMSCFLLPHPGLKVASSPYFDGRLSEIEDNFKIQVQEFVSSLLSSENLVVKEINGKKITGQHWFECFKAYFKIFQVNNLKPKSVFEATAEANNLVAVAVAKDHYRKRMEEVCGNDKPFIDPKELKKEHERYREEAVGEFQSIDKIGGEKKSKPFLKQLKLELDKMYTSYKSNNEAKKKYKNLRNTIAVVAAVSACAGVVAGCAAGVAAVTGASVASRVLAGISAGTLSLASSNAIVLKRECRDEDVLGVSFKCEIQDENTLDACLLEA